MRSSIQAVTWWYGPGNLIIADSYLVVAIVVLHFFRCLIPFWRRPTAFSSQLPPIHAIVALILNAAVAAPDVHVLDEEVVVGVAVIHHHLGGRFNGHSGFMGGILEIFSGQLQDQLQY